MATAPELQGQGVGTRVLRTAVDLVASAGGTLIWCNARVSALGFYERAGFRTPATGGTSRASARTSACPVPFPDRRARRLPFAFP